MRKEKISQKDKEKCLTEINNILTMENSECAACISLYDVARVLKEKNQEYESLKQRYENVLKLFISADRPGCDVNVYDFDYKKNQLKVGYKTQDDYEKIIFGKANEDLYIKSSDSAYGEDVLYLVGPTLSKLYDSFLDYKDFKEQASYAIKSLNSDFYVNVSSFGVSISEEPYDGKFNLFSHSYKEKYDCEINSNEILNSIRGQEDDIFKNIFIKITDCPSWCQLRLYNIRQKNLYDEEQLKKREEKKEMRRVRRKEFFSKILN